MEGAGQNHSLGEHTLAATGLKEEKGVHAGRSLWETESRRRKMMPALLHVHTRLVQDAQRDEF